VAIHAGFKYPKSHKNTIHISIRDNFRDRTKVTSDRGLFQGNSLTQTTQVGLLQMALSMFVTECPRRGCLVPNRGRSDCRLPLRQRRQHSELLLTMLAGIAAGLIIRHIMIPGWRAIHRWSHGLCRKLELPSNLPVRYSSSAEHEASVF